MALDPGLAITGMAVVRWEGDKPIAHHAELLRTKKLKKKELRTVRVMDDDQRRMREIWEAVKKVVRETKPRAIAIEGYSPIPGKQGGGAWKVGAVTQMLVALCWAEGTEPVLVRPADLRKRFLRTSKGTKTDIEGAVGEVVGGASGLIEGFARTQRQHVADALGYAVVAHEEMMRIRTLAGL